MMNRNNFDHYVTKFFAKLFSDGDGTVFIGDLRAGTISQCSDLSRILGFVNWSVDQRIEDEFAKIEGLVTTALRTLRTDPVTIKGWAPGTTLAIRSFIRIHYARSVGLHALMEGSKEQLAKVIKGFVAGSNQVKPGVTRAQSLTLGLAASRDMDIALTGKGCIAICAPSATQFVLGDNPHILLSSQKTQLDRGILRGDLCSPATYFWFPLNPYLGLFFGDALSTPLGVSKIRIISGSEELVKILNRSEGFLATRYVMGGVRDLVRQELQLSNIGDERSKVTKLSWAPYVFNENKAVAEIEECYVDVIRQQLS